MSLQIGPRRSYPSATIAAHLLGYVGEVNATSSQRPPATAWATLIGKCGLEQYWET